MNNAVIIAGGSGTRLWPMSTRLRPKQLLRFIDGRSLLEIAVGRLEGLVPHKRTYICTSASYGDQVAEALAQIPAENILGEPMGRDTANAIGFAAAILAKTDPDAAMAVLTADHIIEPQAAFQTCMQQAFDAVAHSPQTLVTFGIKPTHPATGYGYVHAGEPLAGLPSARRALAFKEKPTQDVARQYLASGEYYWNSGMFVWKAATILAELKRNLPASYDGLMRISAAWGTPHYAGVLAEVYPTLQKISIDYAVMERAKNVAVIPMEVHWLDVGSWTSFAATLPADAAGNKSAGCSFAALESSGVLAVSEDSEHLIAAIGLKDVTIIHTPGATLVCASDKAEQIKQMVQHLQQRGDDRYT